MDASQQKIVQYLSEARATENALVRVLESQIAMTPSGSYRSALDTHLTQTRQHAKRVADRIAALDGGSNPLMVALGFWETVIGQALAVTKTPLDLMRGSGGEEKVLKNAKDACATEALEIATYTAIQTFADAVGDQETATLAASILAEEEKMLQRILREIPQLTDAVMRAEVNGDRSYDVSRTGAGDTVREARDTTQRAARASTATTKRAARKARQAPGVSAAEGQIKGALAGEADLAIARYDALTAEEITNKLPGLSQIDLAKIDAYERKHQDRSTILGRVSSLRGKEPWAGYDELTATEVQAALAEADEERVKDVRAYEQTHKRRAGVLNATERQLTNA
jgi:ferritin-like metal-binding protein YciE